MHLIVYFCINAYAYAWDYKLVIKKIVADSVNGFQIIPWSPTSGAMANWRECAQQFVCMPNFLSFSMYINIITLLILNIENRAFAHFSAKLVKFHIFFKFLAKKYCFENKWWSTTFLEIEFQKLKFLSNFFFFWIINK